MTIAMTHYMNPALEPVVFVMIALLAVVWLAMGVGFILIGCLKLLGRWEDR